MKTRFAIIVDFIITRLLMFCAVFVWARFFVAGLFATIIYSAMITAGLSVLLTTLTRGKRLAKKTSKKLEEQKREVLDQFIYGDTSFALDFFHRALTKNHKVARTLTHLIVDGELALFCKISPTPLSPAEYCECLATTRRLRLKKTVILTHSIHRDTIRMGKLADIESDIYDANAVFSLLQKLDCYPEIKIKRTVQRASFKELLPLLFNRSRVKGYMLTALLMLFATIFMPQTIYYAITTTLLILMAAASQTQIFAQKKNNSVIL